MIAYRPATTPWGKAIEFLLARKGWSLGDLARVLGKDKSELYRYRHSSKKGPTVDRLDFFLNKMGLTWLDWAKAYEAVKKRRVHTVPLLPPSRQGARGKDVDGSLAVAAQHRVKPEIPPF